MQSQRPAQSPEDSTSGASSPGASPSGAAPTKELRLHFTCIWCRESLSVPVRSAGTSDICPNCGARVPIPPLDDEVAGMELATEAARTETVAGDAGELPPPPDEFELAAIEIRAFQQEIERRCDLAPVAVAQDEATQSKPRGAAERRSQYVTRPLATMPAAAQRRIEWRTAQDRKSVV